LADTSDKGIIEMIENAVSEEQFARAYSSNFKTIKRSKDREHMLRVLTSSKIESVDFRDAVEDQLKRSFNFLTYKESGDLYVPGTSQAMTWITHHLNGRISKDQAAWSKRSYQDSGALAPLNLSPSRIVTLYDASIKTRMGLRFKIILNYEPAWLEDYHPTDKIQIASLFCLPNLILNAEDHRRLWVNWSEDEMSLKGQQRWKALQVVVTIKGMLYDQVEIWEI
jgi:hypothetical protein